MSWQQENTRFLSASIAGLRALLQRRIARMPAAAVGPSSQAAAKAQAEFEVRPLKRRPARKEAAQQPSTKPDQIGPSELDADEEQSAEELIGEAVSICAHMEP